MLKLHIFQTLLTLFLRHNKPIELYSFAQMIESLIPYQK